MGIEILPIEELSAKKFGKRIAQAFKDNPTSTAWFFIQQGYPDYDGLDEMEWSDVVELLDKVILEV